MLKPAHTESGAIANRGKTVLALLIVFPALLFIYSDTFGYPFQFDDQWAIEQNRDIRDISDIPAIWSTNPARFLTFFSLAVNYRLGGLDVYGYHLFNFAIHCINGLLVYWLSVSLVMAGRTTGVPCLGLPEDRPGFDFLFPLFVALIFAVHPIQTQAVTYIWQRTTSLAAMFYILSMILYTKSSLAQLRSDDDSRILSNRYLAGSVIVATAAMFTKQNCVTLPIAILLIELFFIGGSIKALREKTYRLSVFIPVMMIIPALTALDKNSELNHIGARGGNILSSYEYLLTQFDVVVMYLRLMVAPVNQCIDHDIAVARSLADSSGSLAVLISLLAFAAWLFNKNRLASFGIIFMFLALSVESSFFPLEDLSFEHRMYLPSTGFIISLAALLFSLLETKAGAGSWKWLATISLIISIPLAVIAKNRNYVWKSQKTLWLDVVKKSPAKTRGHLNLGVCYISHGMIGKAENQFRQAVAIDPESSYGHYHLGLVEEKRGSLDKALKRYRKAIKLDPFFAMAQYAVGKMYFEKKMYSRAGPYFVMAINLQPDYAEAYLKLGAALVYSGRLDDAIRIYKNLLDLNLRNKEANYNLGAVYRAKGDEDKARSYFAKSGWSGPEPGR